MDDGLLEISRWQRAAVERVKARIKAQSLGEDFTDSVLTDTAKGRISNARRRAVAKDERTKNGETP
jgi:hypothetical protein